jgi:mersacidin/lichenicidin family type 2 lantibiotic
MSKRDIIRAWKDEEYRLSLSEAERALLPEHPAGLIELADAELDHAAGGHETCAPCPSPTTVRNCPSPEYSEQYGCTWYCTAYPRNPCTP